MHFGIQNSVKPKDHGRNVANGEFKEYGKTQTPNRHRQAPAPQELDESMENQELNQKNKGNDRGCDSSDSFEDLHRIVDYGMESTPSVLLEETKVEHESKVEHNYMGKSPKEFDIKEETNENLEENKMDYEVDMTMTTRSPSSLWTATTWSREHARHEGGGRSGC